jgi:hypothetical protein
LKVNEGYFLLCPVRTGHHQEVKYSSATPNVQKKLTLPPRRTGCKVGEAQRFCLRQTGHAFGKQACGWQGDLLIYLRAFFADICVSFFPADSRGKGPQIFNLIWWPIEIFAPEEHYVKRKI